MGALLELVSVPAYVFVIIWACFRSQKFDLDNAQVGLECAHGQYPLGKMVLAFEVLVWGLCVVSFAIFQALCLISNYRNKNELRLLHGRI